MTKTIPLYVVITAAYPLRDFDRIPMPEAALFLTEQGAYNGFVRIVDGLHERFPDALFSYGLSGGVRTASVAVRKAGTVLGDGDEWRPVAAVVLREYQTPAGLVAPQGWGEVEAGPEIAGPFYVWCDDSCDNVTPDLEQARQWEREFLDAGRDAWIADADGTVINETVEQGPAIAGRIGPAEDA